jgi:hypothetical protein
MWCIPVPKHAGPDTVSCTTYFTICIMTVFCTFVGVGPGSSVGIATDHGLDGPGSNPGGDEIFRPFRPALGPTQPPVK